MDFLISVFNKLKSSYNIPHQLVITGSIQLQSDTFTEAINNSPFKNDIKYLGFVSNELLHTLYKNAACYIFPSLYEGFGVPLIEAMLYSIPVASSNQASLPEVGGEGCVYFNPLNVDDAANKIKELITNKNIMETIIKKQPEVLKKFDRECSIGKFIDVYQGILNK